ncbi:hypothetical protein CR513_16186, partial [Mucuna pruriens]
MSTTSSPPVSRYLFYGSFPISYGYTYILLVVHCISKWVEAKATKTNDIKICCGFCEMFCLPKALIGFSIKPCWPCVKKSSAHQSVVKGCFLSSQDNISNIIKNVSLSNNFW